MKWNAGGLDRKARLAGGISAMVAGLVAPVGRRARRVLFILGAVELITGLIRYRPMNEASSKPSRLTAW